MHLGPYRAVSMPENRLLKRRFGAYSIRYDRVGEEEIRVSRRFHLLPFEVPPDAYADLVEFCHQVDEADARPIGVAPRSP